jgi:phage-related minor tail protein
MASKEETFKLIFSGVDEITPEMQKIQSSFSDLQAKSASAEKELEKATKQLEKLSETGSEIDSVSLSIGGIGSAAASAGKIVAASAAAVTAAIAAIGVAAIKAGIDIDESAQRTAAALGLPQEKAIELEKVIENVFKTGIPESVEEAAKSVELAFQRFGDVGEAELTRISTAATQVSKLFDADYNSVIAAAGTLTKNFGLTSEQAFDFIAGGFQKGLDGSGDFLDSINEYSTQFRAGGATAEQFFSVMQTGFQEGVLGTDKAADAFAEFRKRVNDDVDATAEALEALGFDSTKYLDQMRSGTKSTADAFQEVILEVQKIKDPVEKQTVLVGLLGTQFEDMGTQAFEAINLAATKIDDLAGSFDKTSDAFKNISTEWSKIWRTALVEITNLDVFEKFVEDIRKYFVSIGENLDEALAGVNFSELEKEIKGLLDVLSDGFSQAFGNIDLTTVEGLKTFIQGAVDGVSELIRTGAQISSFLIPAFETLVSVFKSVLSNADGIKEAFQLVAAIGESLVFAIRAIGDAVLVLLVGTAEKFAGIVDILLYIPGKVIPGIEEFRQKVKDFSSGLNDFKEQLQEDAVESFKKSIDAGGDAVDMFAGKTDELGSKIEALPTEKEITIDAEAKLDDAELQKGLKAVADKQVDVNIGVETKKASVELLEWIDEAGNVQSIEVAVATKVDEKSKELTKEELKDLEKTKIEVQAEIMTAGIRADADKFIKLVEETNATAREQLKLSAEIEIARAESELKKLEAALGSTSSVISAMGDSTAQLFGMFSKDMNLQNVWLLRDAIEQQLKIQREQHELNKEILRMELRKMELQNEMLRNPKKAALNVTFDSSVNPAMEYLLRYVVQHVRIFGTEYGIQQLLEVPA